MSMKNSTFPPKIRDEKLIRGVRSTRHKSFYTSHPNIFIFFHVLKHFQLNTHVQFLKNDKTLFFLINKRLYYQTNRNFKYKYNK